MIGACEDIMIPVVTVSALNRVGDCVLGRHRSIFSWPGMGKLIIAASTCSIARSSSLSDEIVVVFVTIT